MMRNGKTVKRKKQKCYKCEQLVILGGKFSILLPKLNIGTIYGVYTILPNALTHKKTPSHSRGLASVAYILDNQHYSADCSLFKIPCISSSSCFCSFLNSFHPSAPNRTTFLKSPLRSLLLWFSLSIDFAFSFSQ